MAGLPTRLWRSIHTLRTTKHREPIISVPFDPWAQMLSWFQDSDVDEALLNGPKHVCLQRGEILEERVGLFSDQAAMVLWLQEFALSQGVRLDPLVPFNGGLTQGGTYRWHCMLPPVASDGPVMALRRHRFHALSLADFTSSSLTRQILLDVFARRLPLLIAGPTASGKSSLLTALLREVALDERVLSLEALPELPLLSPRWVRLVERQANLEGVGRVSLTNLLEEALRLRPDRIVVGEIRGMEALAFVQAMLTGHGGVAATIHAGSAPQAVERLFALVGRAGEDAERSQTLVSEDTGIAVAMLERKSHRIAGIFHFEYGQWQRLDQTA